MMLRVTHDSSTYLGAKLAVFLLGGHRCLRCLLQLCRLFPGVVGGRGGAKRWSEGAWEGGAIGGAMGGASERTLFFLLLGEVNVLGE